MGYQSTGCNEKMSVCDITHSLFFSKYFHLAISIFSKCVNCVHPSLVHPDERYSTYILAMQHHLTTCS